jgi:hypothetical protein
MTRRSDEPGGYFDVMMDRGGVEMGPYVSAQRLRGSHTLSHTLSSGSLSLIPMWVSF